MTEAVRSTTTSAGLARACCYLGDIDYFSLGDNVGMVSRCFYHSHIPLVPRFCGVATPEHLVCLCRHLEDAAGRDSPDDHKMMHLTGLNGFKTIFTAFLRKQCL